MYSALQTCSFYLVQLFLDNTWLPSFLQKSLWYKIIFKAFKSTLLRKGECVLSGAELANTYKVKNYGS